MGGIEKEIDYFGRVVIPVKFRKKLGIESDSKVALSLDDGVITISPLSTLCALCGKPADKERELRLCSECIMKIKSTD